MNLAENPRTATAAAIKRATLAAHRDIETLDSTAAAELERVYQRAADDIAGQIRLHAGPDENLKLTELRSALAQIEARLQELGRQRDALLDVRLGQAAALGVRPYVGAVAITSDAGLRIADDALRFVRTFVAADGLQLSDRVWRLDRQARDVVVNAIEQAVIQGQGAVEAAQGFLMRGEPVPGDVRSKMNAANAGALAKNARDGLTAGAGAPMDNAMRLFRTEINRAHGEAYMKGGEDDPDFGGWRYLLSPAHPRPDICDLLSRQNLYGLGPGVYPDRARTPWPAHPNTLSFIEKVFKDEISESDRSGKETPLQALERLTPAQQAGVLGKHKHQALKDGKLAAGMIKTPWRAVKLRIGDLKISSPLTRTLRAGIDQVQAVPAALDLLKQNFARGVRLPGATIAQLQSIGRGMGAVLERFSIRVGEIGWIRSGSNRANALFRHYVFGHQPGVNDQMQFSRAYANRALDQAQRSRTVFAEQKQRELARIEALLETAPEGRARTTLENRLEQVKATKRWSASSEAEDPLFTTSAHESGHVLYFFSRAVEQTWIDQLRELHVTKLDMVKVSEYGASRIEELFAEVTALIADGKRAQVPVNIMKAYDAAVAKVK